MRQTKFYVLCVWGDVEPDVRGPYRDAQKQLDAARELRREDQGQESGIYAAKIENGELVVEAY